MLFKVYNDTVVNCGKQDCCSTQINARYCGVSVGLPVLPHLFSTLIPQENCDRWPSVLRAPSSSLSHTHTAALLPGQGFPACLGDVMVEGGGREGGSWSLCSPSYFTDTDDTDFLYLIIRFSFIVKDESCISQGNCL